MGDAGHWERWERIVKDKNADPLEVLTVSTMYQRYFDAVQREAVRVARAAGRSWAEIADAVGIAKQSAWEKWKDVSVERADLQQQVDERVARERRQALHTMA